MDSLNRGQAPFPSSIWKAIDEAASQAARDRLTGRRFIDLEGPFGAGLTTVEVGNDDYCREPGPGEAGAIMGRAISLPMLRKSFRLSIRRIAAHIELTGASQGTRHQLPVHEVAGVMDLHARVPLERGGRDVVIGTDAND